MTEIPFQNFEENENGIVARLAFDIPDNGEETLNSLKQAIEGIKIELDASNRFMKDFMTYVDKAPQISRMTEQFQEKELAFLKQKLDLSEKIAKATAQGSHGGRASGRSSSNPVTTDSHGNVGFDQSSEVSRREQEQESTHQQSLPTVPSGRASSQPTVDLNVDPSLRMRSMMDYREKLGNDLGSDPRLIFEHMRQRGMVSEGIAGGQPSYTVSINGKRVSANELMNNPTLQTQALDYLAQETSPSGDENGNQFRRIGSIGRNALGMLRGFRSGSLVENASGVANAAKGVGGAIGTGDEAIAGLGGLGSGLLIGGGILAGGAAIVGGVEEGGQFYQGLRNLGQTHNQGAGGGFQYEMGMRMMAMNPFISTEQARQIMMAGLNTGYTGKEFDTVTQFMADNLKSMNLDVASSVKLLQTNVQAGGQSVGALGQQLNQLQNLSGVSSSTNKQLQSNFVQTSGNLINQGVAGTTAGDQALQLGQWFQTKNNGQVDPLAQYGGAITNSALGSTMFQGLIATLPGMKDANGNAMPPGTLPQAAIQQSGNNISSNLENVYVYLAQQASHSPDPVTSFQAILSNAGITLNRTAATQLYERFMGPTNQRPNEQATAQQKTAETTGINPEWAKAQLNKNVPGGGVNLGGIGGNIGNFFSDMFSWTQNATNQRQKSDAEAASSGQYQNDQLNSLVQQYGSGDIIVYDPQGKPHQIDYNNKDMMMGLGNGTWQVGILRSDAEKDASKSNWNKEANTIRSQSKTQTLNQWAQGINPSGDTSSGFNGGMIGLTPEASKLVTFLPNSGNVDTTQATANANAGANGATPNTNPVIPSGGIGGG